jgi:hypothetical protein
MRLIATGQYKSIHLSILGFNIYGLAKLSTRRSPNSETKTNVYIEWRDIYNVSRVNITTQGQARFPPTFKHKSANPESQPRARPSDPLMDPEDDGASDSSDDYDLPPFVKKRRKNGPFAKFRLCLHNPDSTKFRATDPVGFRPLAKRNDDSDSDEDKEMRPSDDSGD